MNMRAEIPTYIPGNTSHGCQKVLLDEDKIKHRNPTDMGFWAKIKSAMFKWIKNYNPHVKQSVETNFIQY